MEKRIPSTSDPNKPNLPRRLFWDYNVEKIDWQKGSVGIIRRVIERGTKNEWEILIGFYGKDRVIASLLGGCNSFPDEIVSEISEYFKIRPEELKCYTPTPLRPKHWH